MTKAPARSPHVRIRRLPGDPRIHVTDSGSTTSGYLAGASLEITADDVPTVEVQLSGFDDLVSPSPYNIRANRILAADVKALDLTTRDLAEQHLLWVIKAVTEWLVTAEAPPCGHEDVIDTSTLGDPAAKGMCMWCSAAMVADIHVEHTIGPWRAA